MAAEKLISDRGSSTLDQVVLAALIPSGRYDRHLRRMRVIYARRRARLIAALARHAPGIRLTGLAAGFHAVAHLRAGADEQAVVAAARGRRVGLYGIGDYRAAGRPVPRSWCWGSATSASAPSSRASPPSPTCWTNQPRGSAPGIRRG